MSGGNPVKDCYDRPWTLGGYQLWSDIWVRSGWRVQVGSGWRMTRDGWKCRVESMSRPVRLLDSSNRLVMQGNLARCVIAGEDMAPSMSSCKQAVILLHGLGRTRWVMRRLSVACEAAGYAVANVGYASLREDLDIHVSRVHGVAVGLMNDGAESISLVGHSLGGLVARAAAHKASTACWTPARIVLMGSPSRGSVLAHRLKDFPPFKVIAGPCGQAVTPALAASVPFPDVEMAVIAGGTGGRGYNPFFDRDNDGIVTVDETRLPVGMESDFMLLPSLHTTMPMRHDAISAAVSFIQTGSLKGNQ